MKNPWKKLSQTAPFLLESEKEQILTFNESAKPIVKIQHHVLPEPYIGNPDAPVILLNLNPGYADEDIEYYQTEFVFRLWRKNLFHQTMEYPFYILHPEFDQDLGGTRWWRLKLRQMIEICGVKKVANNICCIEYFPYHSMRYKPLKTVLESQEYNFEMVRKILRNQAIIVMMRREKNWVSVIPELINYKHLYRLNSKQNVAVSRNNCPEGFPKILEVMGC
ncbi:MAG: hypothetical protein IIB95_12255 [Candidatus Marinimicrobia bacterium]|nr:hypothetical protein [Candidatus Neomarinimicrobiota bacterium]